MPAKDVPESGSTDHTAAPCPSWRWRNLAVCNLLALVILASWLWQPTRQLWDQIDLATFRLLNEPLSSNPLWARLWAVASMRMTDIAAALILLVVLIKGDWIFAGPRVRSAFFGFVALLALLVVIRVGLFSNVVRLLHWQHPSPSLTVDGAVRLKELFPAWEESWHLKDSSGQSFPGDHGAVLLLWALFLWPAASGAQRLVVAGLTIVFLLPRLVAGAHWVSDVLVGSLFLALLVIGWGAYSPYAAKAGRWLEALAEPVLNRLRKFPGLGRISLISGR